jgi:ATP-dependent protease Clp ATPase subunit
VHSRDENRNIGEVLSNLEPEDLVQYGLIPEFVGRLPVIATLEELDEAALVQILTEPRNALTKQYAKLFEMEGVEVDFRDDGLRAVAERPWSARQAHGACAPSSKAFSSTRCTGSRRATTSPRWSSTSR